MNKIKFISAVSLFLTGLSFSVKAELIFQLPTGSTGGIENRIENILAQDNLVVIVHRLGVTVSTDGGKSFQNSQISIRNPADNDDSIKNYSIIRIDEKNKFIYITFCRSLYKSEDMGKSFRPLRDFGYYGIDSLSASGSTVIFTKYEYNHGDPVNFISVSHDGGNYFQREQVGDDTSLTFNFVTIHNGKIYLKMNYYYDQILLQSNEKANNFKRIGANNEGWLSVVKEFNQNRLVIYQYLDSLILPPMTIPLFGEYSDQGNARIEMNYQNPEFNSKKATPGIFYGFEKFGKTHYVSSEEVPRFATCTNSCSNIYFASFTKAWKAD